jgi:hypothetical protein
MNGICSTINISTITSGNSALNRQYMLLRLRGHQALVLLSIVLVLFNGCAQPPSFFIKNNDPNLAYAGRIGTGADASVFYWPGSSVTMDFEGTQVRALLKDDSCNDYFYAIIDSATQVRFRLDTMKHSYILASGLSPGRHSVQLFKLTDVLWGKTWFYGFILTQGDKVLSPPPPPVRKIEFYGNSVTTGCSVEMAPGEDSGDGIYCNNYLSYAAITARHYNAGFHCISMSGIGLMAGWVPVIMPELYNRVDPDGPAGKWDFSKFTPAIVVIDLLQNDTWLVNMPDNPQFKIRFGTKKPGETYIVNAYKNFVETIRSKYPAASIICTLGNTDATKEGSPWPGYIVKAVGLINDPNIYTHFFPFKNTPGHPKIKEQQAMAQSLISFIDERVKW